MNIPPDAHVILGLAVLGFAVVLALANWRTRGTR